MKESIKISTLSVIIGTIQMVIISFLLIGCNTQKSDFKVIQTEIVSKDYQYNPNGFLEYTPLELKEDVVLLKSLDIDTIYSDKKYISFIKEKKNDTIFYLSNNKIVIKTK